MPTTQTIAKAEIRPAGRVALLGMLFGWTFSEEGMTVRRLTLFFSTFVFFQFWNMFNAKGFETRHSVFTCLKGCREFFLILLAIQFLQIVVAFIPGEVVQVAAGMIYGPWVGALIIWVGCIISSAFIFVLVHKLGAPFVQAMVPEKYMGKFRDWETSDKFNVIVFILFLIPGLPKDVFTYITPLTHMSMKNFVLISNFARIPGIVLSTYAAAGLVSGNIVESVIIFAVTAAVAIVALVVYGRVTKKSNGSEK